MVVFILWKYLNKEVKRYNKQYINEKRAFGELGHPDDPNR